MEIEEKHETKRGAKRQPSSPTKQTYITTLTYCVLYSCYIITLLLLLLMLLLLLLLLLLIVFAYSIIVDVGNLFCLFLPRSTLYSIVNSTVDFVDQNQQISRGASAKLLTDIFQDPMLSVISKKRS